MTTAKGGQPIGKRIRQVCAAVEQGACNSLAVAAVANLPSKEVARYALRAEKHGLMKIERDTWPYSYVVQAGWQHLLERREKKPRPSRSSRPLPANSVFQWAGATA